MSQNNVIFKVKNNCLIIILNDKISFEELKISLKEKTVKSAEFFRGADIPINFKGRSISDSEELELLDIISENLSVDISFVYTKDEKPIFIKRKNSSKNVDSDRQKNNKENTNDKNTDNKNISKENVNKKDINKKDIDKNFNNKNIINTFENITSFHKGSVRGGQSLRFKGSIVIIGDVNPGGEVIAEGNVVVLGSVKGLVHAGCKGLTDCFIAALKFNPSQIRIADVIAFLPEIKRSKLVPKRAFVRNGEIYVEPLMNL